MRFKTIPLITGGGGEIVKAYATAFAKEGAKLSLPAEAEEGQDHQHFFQRRAHRQPNYIHYVTSNDALIAMTRAMARELGNWSIGVNTVSPGFVVAEGRQVDPAYEKIRVRQRSIKRTQVENDLVGAVLFLSSNESDFITGQSLNVDGGFHFVG